MSKILSSASKIVFLLMAVTVCVSFIIHGLSEANFMLLAGAVFTFYFSNKGEVKPTNDLQVPYAGK